MLEIKNLTITHTTDLRTLFEDFSLTLNPGDKIALIGEEGNGKSTLLKAIADPQAIEDYAIVQGEIYSRNERIGYVPQLIDPTDRDMRIQEYLEKTSGAVLWELPELYRITDELGLQKLIDQLDRAIGTLSGGERVKLQLLAAMLSEPTVLLLDEPTNDIDLAAILWVERFIQKSSLPILFTSHDEELLRNCANGIVHVERISRKTIARTTVSKLGYEEYLKRRDDQLSHQAQMAKSEKTEAEKQMERYRRMYQKVEHKQDSISRKDPAGGRLLKKKMANVKAMGRRFERDAENRTRRPEVEESIFVTFDEDCAIPNGKTVLSFACDELKIADTVLAKGIRLNLTGPEKVGIVGANGVGKSTLLKALYVELEDRADLRIGYMPQDYEVHMDDKTAVEYLLRADTAEERTKVQTLLGSAKFTADEMNHPMTNLSGGQKAKLFFMKLVQDRVNVLLLDEPTRNLSPLSGPVVRESIRNFGGAMIAISHDRRFLSECCDAVYELTPEGLRLI